MLSKKQFYTGWLRVGLLQHNNSYLSYSYMVSYSQCSVKKQGKNLYNRVGAWLFKSVEFGNGSRMSDENLVILEQKMVETSCKKC